MHINIQSSTFDLSACICYLECTTFGVIFHQKSFTSEFVKKSRENLFNFFAKKLNYMLSGRHLYKLLRTQMIIMLLLISRCLKSATNSHNDYVLAENTAIDMNITQDL